jgi:hypothetical protein
MERPGLHVNIIDHALVSLTREMGHFGLTESDFSALAVTA